MFASARPLLSRFLIIIPMLLVGCGSANVATKTSGTSPTASPAPASNTAASVPVSNAGLGCNPPAAPSRYGVDDSFVACFALSGAVTGSGGFTAMTGSGSCAKWLQGKNVTVLGSGGSVKQLNLPDPSNSDQLPKVNGNDVEATFSIAPFSGPGHYTKNDFFQSLYLGSATYSSTQATFDATVNADGSGSLAFKHLANDSGQAVDYTLNWKCVPGR